MGGVTMRRRTPKGAFADRLRSLRQQHEWSQSALGMRADMTPNHIYHLENGCGEPNMETMRRLADAFGLTLSELLEGVS
jgi:transcriptional regulator with XRE-family HTH domain